MQHSSEPEAIALANRLHSAAIHLLRRLRVHDEAAGLSAPRLSALSVIVHAGPISVTALASAEQVRPPTISRLVGALEREGLVQKQAHPEDRRVQLLVATEAGRQLLEAGRARRVEALAADIARLPATDRAVLAQASGVLAQLTRPPEQPPQP